MSGKNFYKNKKSFEIDAIDIDKEPYGKKAHLNTLLDIMMMMSLKFYLYGFLKWLALIVIRQYLSRLAVCSCHFTYATSLVKWLSVRLRMKWFWIGVQL